MPGLQHVETSLDRDHRRSKCRHQCSTYRCPSTGVSRVRATSRATPAATASTGCTRGIGPPICRELLDCHLVPRRWVNLYSTHGVTRQSAPPESRVDALLASCAFGFAGHGWSLGRRISRPACRANFWTRLKIVDLRGRLSNPTAPSRGAPCIITGQAILPSAMVRARDRRLDRFHIASTCAWWLGRFRQGLGRLPDRASRAAHTRARAGRARSVPAP